MLDGAKPSRELTLHAVGTQTLHEFALEQAGTITFWLPQDDPMRLGGAEFVSSVRSPGCPQDAREAAAMIAALEALKPSVRDTGRARAVAGLGLQEPRPCPGRREDGGLRAPSRA